MGIIGSLVGGALGIGGSIFGGISASKAMKKIRGNYLDRQRENLDWYDRRWNEDATQKADAQRILAIMDERMRNSNKGAAGQAAVMGGDVPVNRFGDDYAEAVSRIAVHGDQTKSGIEKQYMETKAQLDDKMNELYAQQANNTANAVKGVTQSAANMFDLIPDPKKWRPSQDYV